MFAFEHVDGSGLPETKSRSSLVSKKCSEQEWCGPDGGFSAEMDWNRITAAVEAEGGRGTQNAITKYIKKNGLWKILSS